MSSAWNASLFYLRRATTSGSTEPPFSIRSVHLGQGARDVVCENETPPHGDMFVVGICDRGNQHC